MSRKKKTNSYRPDAGVGVDGLTLEGEDQSLASWYEQQWNYVHSVAGTVLDEYYGR